MSFHGTSNPTGLLPMERVIRNSAPQDNHSYCRLFKELGLEMTGYGPSLFGNRLVRTRMLGGVGAGGEKPPATRLGDVVFVHLFMVSQPRATWETAKLSSSI